jgi:hypothetical protein
MPAYLVTDDVAVELVGGDKPYTVKVEGLPNVCAIALLGTEIGGLFLNPRGVAVHEVEAFLRLHRLEQGQRYRDNGKEKGMHCG